MKRFFIICLAFFGLFLGSTAHPVDQETATSVASKFMKTQKVTLATVYQTDLGIPALYVFNTSESFVIVAADDCETPIIGYSHEGRFDPDDVPIQMEEYLQDFVARIQYGIENQIIADEITSRQWELVKATGKLNSGRSSKAVEPLITTKWHQGCLYNSLCPEMNGPCGHAEVGCVAVAMGQIMNYWEFPEIGSGTHSYYTAFGTLAADFGNTNYHYEMMPDILSEVSGAEEIDAVATLLYHCGVSVNMSYTETGSGAHSSDVPIALKVFFKYSDEMYRENMNNDPEGWLDKVKACLDNERPLLYSGFGSSGHAFVCDGYDGNELLHFNWGWGGNGDGYFALGHLNPLGHNYNNSNSAIFDITPDNTPHLVSATANPTFGGTIEGNGFFLSDQLCTLTASPAENYEFLYWKQDDQILSYHNIYSFYTIEDVDNIEAVFSLKQVQSITAEVSSQGTVNLTWYDDTFGSWPLLKQFNIQKAQNIATDGNHLYLSKSDHPLLFWKYSMEGSLINQWSSGINAPTCLAYDGELFYCNARNYAYLFSYNMSSQSVGSSIRTGYTPVCSYDHVRDGIWIALYNSPSHAYQMKLIDKTGMLIQNGPLLPTEVIPNGSGFFVGDDRDSHLIIKTEEGRVYDYDIEHDWLYQCNADLGTSYGTFICYREGKTIMYVCYDNDIRLFGISNAIRPWPITRHRLYRSDDKGNVTMLSDQISGTSYADTSWGELEVGLYRYGISSVFGNGNESEILWSNALTKGNYGIDENLEPDGNLVKKVVEDGHLVIIKEGKRYNITGQEIR